ncbi:hypothetical protein EG329_009562 [Mollisiaceae sp. DMI_Dod_QoI]|nr:hypothetical protein EG329_009562 [Helotiales sp. DMI_Dod_QoI]
MDTPDSIVSRAAADAFHFRRAMRAFENLKINNDSTEGEVEQSTGPVTCTQLRRHNAGQAKSPQILSKASYIAKLDKESGFAVIICFNMKGHPARTIQPFIASKVRSFHSNMRKDLRFRAPMARMISAA